MLNGKNRPVFALIKKARKLTVLPDRRLLYIMTIEFTERKDAPV